jgi:hypothetical protein
MEVDRLLEKLIIDCNEILLIKLRKENHDHVDLSVVFLLDEDIDALEVKKCLKLKIKVKFEVYYGKELINPRLELSSLVLAILMDSIQFGISNVRREYHGFDVSNYDSY